MKIRDNKHTKHLYVEMLKAAFDGLDEIKKARRNNNSNQSQKRFDNSQLVDTFEHLQRVRYTDDEFKDSPKTVDELVHVLRPKKLSHFNYNKKLAKLGALCDYFDWVGHLYEITISQNGSLLRIYKHQQTIGKLIALAKQIGLVKCVDTYYSKSLHVSMKYIWNIHVKRMIVELVKQAGINKFNNKLLKRANTVVNYNEVDVGDAAKEEVEKFGEDDFVRKTFNIELSAGLRVAGCSDERALSEFYKKYPMVQDIQKIIDEDNEKLEGQDKIHQTSYRPKIKRSKGGYITKMSIRATSEFTRFISKENFIKKLCVKGYSEWEANLIADKVDTTKFFGGMWREDYIKQYFANKGIDYWVHYDTTGSIYTIQHYKKTGTISKENIYNLMLGQEIEGDEKRFIKPFDMKYMFDYSAKSIHSKLCQSFGIENKRLVDFNKSHSDMAVVENGVVKPLSLQLVEYYYNKLQGFMDNHKKCTEIFMDESNIYAMFVCYLRKRGWTVLQVYDGFWIGGKNATPTKESIQKMVFKFIKDYFKKYYGINEQTDEISLAVGEAVESKNNSHCNSCYKVSSQGGVSSVSQHTPHMYNTHTEVTTTSVNNPTLESKNNSHCNSCYKVSSQGGVSSVSQHTPHMYNTHTEVTTTSVNNPTDTSVECDDGSSYECYSDFQEPEMSVYQLEMLEMMKRERPEWMVQRE